MGYLINKEDAIKSLEKFEEAATSPENEYNYGRRQMLETCIYEIEDLPSAWIPVTKELPEMHDAGILKKFGIQQRSKMVFITIEVDDPENSKLVDADAELRDGEWHSDTLKWLGASGKN